jgi:hypothetical protein
VWNNALGKTKFFLLKSHVRLNLVNAVWKCNFHFVFQAFLAAWEEACAHPGKSTLYIPDGTFFVGPVSFIGPCHNNQSPNVEIRGTLKAPSSLDAFTTPNWIVFRNLKGIKLTGGTRMAELDAQGAEAWTCTTCHKNKKFPNFPIVSSTV